MLQAAKWHTHCYGTRLLLTRRRWPRQCLPWLQPPSPAVSSVGLSPYSKEPAQPLLRRAQLSLLPWWRMCLQHKCQFWGRALEAAWVNMHTEQLPVDGTRMSKTVEQVPLTALLHHCFLPSSTWVGDIMRPKRLSSAALYDGIYVTSLYLDGNAILKLTLSLNAMSKQKNTVAHWSCIWKTSKWGSLEVYRDCFSMSICHSTVQLG